MVEAVEVDDPNAALDDLRDVLVAGVKVLLQTAPEQLRRAANQRPTNPLPVNQSEMNIVIT